MECLEGLGVWTWAQCSGLTTGVIFEKRDPGGVGLERKLFNDIWQVPESGGSETGLIRWQETQPQEMEE